MQNTFSAVLIRDISYLDLDGRLFIQRAGTPVTVTQITEELFYSCQNLEQGNVSPGSFIASIGPVSFDINNLEFQAFN